MAQKQFHKHYATKGPQLFWIIFTYLVLAWFIPVLGWAALICMIGPVLTSVWKGRFWCGNVCPRGNMYDRLLSKYSPHRPIPKFVRSFGFRLFMVFFIFAMFGIQMYFAWGDWGAMGRVFWKIIVMTTIVGVILSFIYAPEMMLALFILATIGSIYAAHRHNKKLFHDLLKSNSNKIT